MNSSIPAVISERPDYSGELWQLLSEQSRLFTSGDSSSVPEDTARDLLQSILFTLDTALPHCPHSEKSSLSELLKEGQKQLAKEVEDAKALLCQVQSTVPPADNIAYKDTLLALEGFFQYYDLRCMAHHIPCMIDYQLAQPVKQSLQGIGFIGQYLHRLLMENLFCQAFSPQHMRALLSVYCLDYKRLLINLFDPLFVNSAGLCLLGKDPRELHISETDRDILLALFRSDKGRDAEAALVSAVPRELCHTLDISQEQRPALEAYLSLCGGELAGRARLLAHSAGGTFDQLFLSFPLQFCHL